jgi:O-antigen/teichoic acid export membrane protein
VALALLAAPAIDLLYGERWAAIVPLLPLACALAFGQGLLTLFVPLLVAAGATGARLRGDLIYLGLALLALAALPLGLAAYMLAQATAVALASIAFAALVHRQGWIDRGGWRDALLPPLQAAVTAAVPATLILATVAGAPGAVLTAATFLTLYALTLRLVSMPLLDELLGVLPGASALRRAAFISVAAKSSVPGPA